MSENYSRCAEIFDAANRWYEIYGKANQPSPQLFDDHLFDLEMRLSRDEPRSFLLYIGMILSKDLTEFAYSVIGAGHFEEFIRRHGDNYLLEISQLMGASERFKRVLQNTWESPEMSDQVRGMLRGVQGYLDSK